MSSMMTPEKTDRGWVIEIPPEMTEALGVAEGSFALLQARDGKIEVEILPPASPELKQAARRIAEKYQEAFEELKRLGD